MLELPAGARRRRLETWMAGSSGPAAMFAGRVFALDAASALVWARLMSEGRRRGKPRGALDMVAAATAEAHGCTVVTRNVRDFSGIPVLDPAAGR